jgi:hypothetical protein
VALFRFSQKNAPGKGWATVEVQKVDFFSAHIGFGQSFRGTNNAGAKLSGARQAMAARPMPMYSRAFEIYPD